MSSWAFNLFKLVTGIMFYKRCMRANVSSYWRWRQNHGLGKMDGGKSCVNVLRRFTLSPWLTIKSTYRKLWFDCEPNHIICDWTCTHTHKHHRLSIHLLCDFTEILETKAIVFSQLESWKAKKRKKPHESPSALQHTKTKSVIFFDGKWLALGKMSCVRDLHAYCERQSRLVLVPLLL